MNNVFIRIAIITLALFGVYKMFPQISGPIDYYVKNPKFQESVVIPSVNVANKVLPDKLQVPTPEVMGVSSEYVENSPLKEITDEIASKAGVIAADQIEQIRKAASAQFCSILLEKIKTECAQ